MDGQAGRKRRERAVAVAVGGGGGGIGVILILGGALVAAVLGATVTARSLRRKKSTECKEDDAEKSTVNPAAAVDGGNRSSADGIEETEQEYEKAPALDQKRLQEATVLPLPRTEPALLLPPPAAESTSAYSHRELDGHIDAAPRQEFGDSDAQEGDHHSDMESLPQATADAKLSVAHAVPTAVAVAITLADDNDHVHHQEHDSIMSQLNDDAFLRIGGIASIGDEQADAEDYKQFATQNQKAPINEEGDGNHENDEQEEGSVGGYGSEQDSSNTAADSSMDSNTYAIWPAEATESSSSFLEEEEEEEEEEEIGMKSIFDVKRDVMEEGKPAPTDVPEQDSLMINKKGEEVELPTMTTMDGIEKDEHVSVRDSNALLRLAMVLMALVVVLLAMGLHRQRVFYAYNHLREALYPSNSTHELPS